MSILCEESLPGVKFLEEWTECPKLIFYSRIKPAASTGQALSKYKQDALYL